MRILFLSFIVLLLASCGPSEDPVTPAEAAAFARSVDSSIREGQFSRLDQVIDQELLARETARTAGMTFDAAIRKGVAEGLSKNGFSQQVSNSVAQDGSYQLLRTYEKEGRQHMIFRLYGSDGINYHDFSLTKRQGKIVARDVYILITGEMLSETLAGLLKTLKDKSSDPDRQAERMQRAARQMRLENYRAARASLDSISSAVRGSRPLQIMNIIVNSHLDSADYAQALSEFQHRFGSDPSAQFALFDHYFTRKDWERSHQIINSMDRLVQDPMLDFYRGIIFEQEGKTAEALAALERLQKAMPDFESGALELLTLYVSKGDVDKGNRAIQAYKAHKDFHPEYLPYIRLKYSEQSFRFNW